MLPPRLVEPEFPTRGGICVRYLKKGGLRAPLFSCPARFIDLPGGHTRAMADVRVPVRVAWPGIRYRCVVCDEVLWWLRRPGVWRHWDAGRDVDHQASPGRWCLHAPEVAVRRF